MTNRLRRTIEEVFFDELGSLTARELLAMPREDWQYLRARITDSRHGKKGMVARCIACSGEVYIQTANGRPLFSHYQGSDIRCPWYSGKNMHPDDVRRQQYNGKQESEAHRRMCQLIASLCALDRRCEETKIDEYLPPTGSAHGRYPDVLVNWRDFGRFAVEYQMSNTFQTEISQHCLHYEREGIPLLWVLSSFDAASISQAVSDVIHRHRGNAFVLDQRAVSASRRESTLVLSCFVSNGENFESAKLVRFDKLKFPISNLPYFEDRVTQNILQKICSKRSLYFRPLREWGHRTENLPIDALAQFADRARIDRLVAAAFSIMTFADGKFENFASNHKDIKAMLNTYLNLGKLSPYANLLTALIKNTSQSSLLQGTVKEHLNRAASVNQVREGEPEWRLLQELFPEALDPFIRQRLKDADALPAWASEKTDVYGVGQGTITLAEEHGDK